MSETTVRKTTVRTLQTLTDKGEKIVALTAYDALMAGLAEECGVHMILVGDSVGMTMLGFESTIPVTLEHCLHHTAAVVRGVRSCLVVADMPFLTYQVNTDEAVRNAGRFLQEAGADAVKLEGGVTMAPTIRRLVEAGIPVLGHIGIMPQSILTEGGYRVHGRKTEEAAALESDAAAIAEAGAFGIVLEGMPTGVSRKITEAVPIPTIGIGAGPDCNGQVQVIHDILGLFEKFVPRHTRHYANLASLTRDALKAYAEDVRTGQFPSENESFT